MAKEVIVEKKLSPKVIMHPTKIGKKLFEEKGEKTVDLFQIGGVITSMKSGSSQYGDFIAFVGEFRSINCETGEVKNAKKVFLPSILTEELSEKIAKADGKPVEFLTTVGIKANDDERGGLGYAYYAKYHLKPEQKDALEDMFKELPRIAPKALPSSKTAKG
jgi:hypothetical protein